MPRKTDEPVGNSQMHDQHARLWKVRESRRWLYFPKKDSSKE